MEACNRTGFILKTVNPFSAGQPENRKPACAGFQSESWPTDHSDSHHIQKLSHRRRKNPPSST
jgi:hypothetical protein